MQLLEAKAVVSAPCQPKASRRRTTGCNGGRTSLDKVDTFSERWEVSGGQTDRAEEGASLQPGVQANRSEAQRDTRGASADGGRGRGYSSHHALAVAEGGARRGPAGARPTGRSGASARAQAAAGARA